MDGAFFRQQLQLYAMDRVHGLHLYRAPVLLLRRHATAIPATELGEGARGRYIRSQGCTRAEDRTFNFIFSNMQAPAAKEEASSSTVAL